MKNLMMVALAVCFAVFAVNANAATLTVAHTDLTLAGGISATYNYVSDHDDQDHFSLDSALIHLFKDPTVDSPVGGHLALAGFDVKTVTGQEVEPTIGDELSVADLGDDNFRPWLAYFSYMPVENLTFDAGLLWHKFGEAPVAILNPHVTRPVAFLAQPVAFAGARLSYDAGMVNFYIGYNDGSALDKLYGDLVSFGNKDGMPDPKHPGEDLENDNAFEVGICAKIAEMLNIAVNYFDHNEGYDTINASVGIDMEKFHAKVEANFVSTDTENTLSLKDPIKHPHRLKRDNAISYALYACCKLTDTVKLPLRLELVDDNDSGIYAGYEGWNLTISPTYMPTKNSFIKLEGVYAADNDEKLFTDDDGKPEDSRHAVIAEFGFLF